MSGYKYMIKQRSREVLSCPLGSLNEEDSLQSWA